MENYIFKDLIIGATSQVAQYMPAEILRISSRNIPEWVYEKEWNRVYVCFAEQRTAYATNNNYRDLFYNINVGLVLQCVKKIKSKKIIVFSTTELWNECSGAITLDTPFCFKENYYTESKLIMTTECKKIDKVIVVYPFNFNSIHRGEVFLFGKIFSSIKNKTLIEIGNTYFYRDVLHARYVAKRITEVKKDAIIGSGRVIYINDYIRDLYKGFNLVYEKYVKEDLNNKNTARSIFWLKSAERQYTYENLLIDSMKDIKK
jgi:hypothetical protein